MDRQDALLAWMLQYENIAWYEKGYVRILDRRIYPIETKFVKCWTHEEVAAAIKAMVTQSAGPYVAASMGMALAAYECRGKSVMEQLDFLAKAAHTLSHARPTTSKRMEKVVGACLDQARRALIGGMHDVSLYLRDYTVHVNNLRYYRIGLTAKHLVEKFPRHGAIMTQCFGETIVGQMLKEARKEGKEVAVFCPETRPYFQGSRLTATVAKDMGFDVTVITDNMPAMVMKKERIDLFTSAADAICCDGHIVNKVGTYQIAIAAKYHEIPYYATGAPDQGHPTIDTVQIEMRDPDFVLQAMGTPTANPGVKGYYPAFDITPPELVTGVATDKGILSPYELDKYDADKDDFLV